ncbi:MAG: S8 family serine peptidase [Acidobacteriota bacterium]|nr:S8 family serine peptidase [Blastocatellia bacterium]MDW8411863.1 S8 family serine peptidase [Acidobacteriota bacterium]
MDKRICSICFHEAPVYHSKTGYELSDHVLELVRENIPRWNSRSSICNQCENRLVTAHAELDQYLVRQGLEGQRILPTPVRLGASPRFTGRGVTIAFLDSGFYWHPDLTRPEIRIVRYVDIFSPRARVKDLMKKDVSSWHGMMTSVVAAGNGFLSGGIFRGIASDARLVLIKIGSSQRIRHEDITWGLKWVLKHRHRYNIRIVNISCGGDYEVSYLHDELSQTAEACVKAGIVVVAAAGNEAHAAVIPPASSPSVITVGGLDDQNSLDPSTDKLYHSSYGPTIDGLQKPEIIAPSIWVAAPILPGTPTAAQAMLLDELERLPDWALRDTILKNPGIDPDLDAAVNLEPYHLRNLVLIKMRSNNVISGHYKHVDGTSFAAPIVSSVVAQMLEANPSLTPQEVKRILIKTAERIPGVDTDRQGWGVVNPRSAVAQALEMALTRKSKELMPSGV